MKTTLLKFLVCVAAVLGLAATSHAAINGSIGFGGTYTQNGGTLGNLSTATSMTRTITMTSGMGDLVGAVPVVFSTLVGVNGNAPSLVGMELWSVTVGADTYTFTLTSEVQTFTSTTQLNLVGNGIMRRNGGDDTAGTWQLGFGVSGRSFTWQSTSATNVPDGGTTLLLLGAALSGLALIRRKLA